MALLLGSIMSFAITGSAPFLPTLAAGGALLGCHSAFALLAQRTDRFGPLVKGSRINLIERGRVLPGGLRLARITANDLRQALRLQAKQDDPSKIRRAYMERSGQISVVPYSAEARVVE